MSPQTSSEFLDPKSIIIEDRQRKSLAIDSEFIQSVNKRLINPITLRKSDSGPILVAGGRRLQALISGGTELLTENIHFRYFENLSQTEAKVIELEENIKREDLSWRDQVSAVGELHAEYMKRENWTKEKTANELNFTARYIRQFLTVHSHLNSPSLRDATNLAQAYSILQNIAERRTASLIQDLSRTSAQIFDSRSEPENVQNSENSTHNSGSDINSPSKTSAYPIPHSEQSSNVLPNTNSSNNSPPSDQKAVINSNFLTWASTYSGPKFTLIHCDFPYDIKYDSYAKSVTATAEDYDFSGFWPLLDCLLDNLDRLASYSSHIMFWFSMKFYCQTKSRLESAGLYVHEHPFVWLKSDNSGIIPGRDAIFPRRIYETAFLCNRGRRPLIKSLANAYSAPTASNPVHPSQKPEPVLRHFFSMLIDETTDFLDPTCGSGTSLRAAEDTNARSVLGIELDPNYARSAESLLQNARKIRKLNQ